MPRQVWRWQGCPDRNCIDVISGCAMGAARNLITDIAGLRVGQAGDAELASGVTVVVFDAATVASVDLRGGGPGTRETALLDPAETVEGIDAIVLSGGSAFGLDAASGVQAYLREQGRGFRVRDARVPIVPAAILFDLLSGGDKDWGRYPPYRELGHAAAAVAATDFALGSVGAGTGATTVHHERGREFGGHGWPTSFSEQALKPVTKGTAGQSTTLVVVATDAILSKMQAKRLAVMAQSGLSRAIYPVHTPLDGDVVFAASTGRRPLGDPHLGLARLG